jgi:hypothetical protein
MTRDAIEREALARLEQLLEAYGAAPRRWPADRRAWAEDLLARSAEARGLAQQAAALDQLLDDAKPEAASAALIGRVLAAAPRPAPRRLPWYAGLLKPVTGFALAAILGLALGGVISPFPTGNGEAQAESLAFDAALVAEIEL